MSEEESIVDEKPVSLLTTFLRAFFGFGFSLAAVYFLTWAVLASWLGNWGAIGLLAGCAMLCGLGATIFGYMYRSTDVFMPKYHSMFFYSLMGILSLVTGALLAFHIETFQSLPDRVRLPAQILQIVVYVVLFIYCLIRISEARFLPPLNSGKDTGEVWK